jgi:hypothetical protein
MPRERKTVYCKKCLELGIESPKTARKEGLCATHGEKKYCRLCLEEQREAPKVPKFKDLCKEHYENSSITENCEWCLKLYLEEPVKVKPGDLCSEHKGLCIRCLQFKVEDPQKIKGREICDFHKDIRPPCRICVEHNTGENIHNARQNGLCLKHGAEKVYCTGCIEKGVKPNLARKKGMCLTCLGDDESTICEVQGCERKIRKENLCKTCYKIKKGILKPCIMKKDCENYTYDRYCKECIYEKMMNESEIKDTIEYRKGKKLCYVKKCSAFARCYGLCFKHSDFDYKEKVINKQLIYQNKKYREDINYKLAKILRSRLRELVTSDFKSDSALKLVGCSIEYLKFRLESQFEEGMSWDNYGEWHIDHIRPCISYDLDDEEQQGICFGYKNLQPLWGPDNISKGGVWE